MVQWVPAALADVPLRAVLDLFLDTSKGVKPRKGLTEADIKSVLRHLLNREMDDNERERTKWLILQANALVGSLRIFLTMVLTEAFS